MTTPQPRPPGLLARLFARLFRRKARPEADEITLRFEHQIVWLGEIKQAEDGSLAAMMGPPARKLHKGRTRDILAALEAGPLTRREIKDRLPGPPATIDCVSALLYDASQAGLVARRPGRRWGLTKAGPGFRLEADR